MSDAMKAYNELQHRERDREGKSLGNGAPVDLEYLRALGATGKPIESPAVWTFPDGSKLQARRGRLYQS